MTYTEKLDDKIKSLNSTRVFKKVTPKYDLSWYIKWTASLFVLIGVACRRIKWTASLFVLIGVACRSVEEVPKIYDVYFSFVGVTGWFLVGMLWHDRALILLNGVLFFMLLISILRHIFGGL